MKTWSAFLLAFLLQGNVQLSLQQDPTPILSTISCQGADDDPILERVRTNCQCSKSDSAVPGQVQWFNASGDAVSDSGDTAFLSFLPVSAPDVPIHTCRWMNGDAEVGSVAYQPRITDQPTFPHFQLVSGENYCMGSRNYPTYSCIYRRTRLEGDIVSSISLTNRQGVTSTSGVLRTLNETHNIQTMTVFPSNYATEFMTFTAKCAISNRYHPTVVNSIEYESNISVIGQTGPDVSFNDQPAQGYRNVYSYPPYPHYILHGERVQLRCSRDVNTQISCACGNQSDPTTEVTARDEYSYVASVDEGICWCNCSRILYTDCLTNPTQVMVVPVAKTQGSVNSQRNITVQAGDTVEFVCRAFSEIAGSLSLAVTKNGTKVLETTETTIRDTRTMTCSDGGLYICELYDSTSTFDNVSRSQRSDNLTVYVTCPVSIHANFEDETKIKLSSENPRILVPIVGYPDTFDVTVQEVTKLENDRLEKVRNMTVRTQIERDGAESLANLVITMDERSEGLYLVEITNEAGQKSERTFTLYEEDDDSDDNLGIYLGVGIGVAVVVLCVGAFALYRYRRNRKTGGF